MTRSSEGLDLKEYLYLDEPGIESLYAQTVDYLEVEKTVSLEKALTGKASLRLSFRHFLLRLLGGSSLDASGEIEGARKRVELSKRKMTIQRKLSDLVRVLEKAGKPVYFASLAEAANEAAVSKRKVFVDIVEEFNAPQFVGSSSGHVLVNECGYLLLERGGPFDHDDRDDYYKRSQVHVKMSASVTKLPRTYSGIMTATGHDAVILRGHKGLHIPLRVFGTLISLGEDSYQIKPYAIWR